MIKKGMQAVAYLRGWGFWGCNPPPPPPKIITHARIVQWISLAFENSVPYGILRKSRGIAYSTSP